MNKTKRTLLIVCCILGVFGILIFTIIQITSGPRNAATIFFQLLKENKIAEAYDLTSEIYKKQNNIKNFTDNTQDNDWSGLAKTFWNKTNISGTDSAVISGSITMAGGAVIPASLQLVKENGKWKISKIETDVFNQKKILKVPSDGDNNKLVSDTLSVFVDAVKKENFIGFYQSISKFWQVETNAAELQKIFQSFIDIDNQDGNYLMSAIAMTPVLSAPPNINENNLLVLSGYYLNNKGNLYFDLKYIYEYPAWKLIGIDLNVK